MGHFAFVYCVVVDIDTTFLQKGCVAFSLLQLFLELATLRSHRLAVRSGVYVDCCADMGQQQCSDGLPGTEWNRCSVGVFVYAMFVGHNNQWSHEGLSASGVNIERCRR